ncbi:thermonuclease family protein [Bradyrhizobium sp. URHA0013]|uniref:thermonuclease family protein n=1 Tax=Bradyrhizobium sp. URHA0013 TaxID=1380352 RepID=UPI0035270AA5
MSVLLTLATFCHSVSASAVIKGQASIIDGDTLDIHGTHIRLWGIDAPESSQFCRGEDSLPYRCGAKSANELDKYIAAGQLALSP